MKQSIHSRLPSFLHPLPPSSSSSNHNSFSPSSSPKPPIFLTSPRPPLSLPKPPSIDSSFPFREKMLFLDSLGIDLFSLTKQHPPIISSSLADLRDSVEFLSSLGFSSTDLRRICGMCPEILTSGCPSAFTSVLTFLLREAGVQKSDLRYVISRRPRLLVSDVSLRLRPTLYFLRMLGVSETKRCAHLLSCSVEEKFLPRLEFLGRVGFSPRDARSMARRFPQIFCYSIEGNLEPKIEFLVGRMERGLREIREFPQYFSFSLEKRIEPRCRVCEENGVLFELPALLKPSDEEFRRRMGVCVSSSVPLRRSPLWKEGLGGDYL